MTNILLIDFDSVNGFPNLALMKISSYHKAKGDKVYLKYRINPDKVYISCIFTRNRHDALGTITTYPKNAEVLIGGSGVNYARLPEEIEHQMPDYELYNIDYSMGFLTRGCIRNCPFCIVPQKEGRFKEHAELEEFLHPTHNKLVLLDNNLLASKRIMNILNYFIEHNIKVNFNQGLDIRLVTHEIAQKLSEIKYYDLDFRDKRIYFAWDLMKDEELIINKLDLIKQYISKNYIMVYILTGYNTTFEQDLYRFNKLWSEMGVTPFIMLYNNNSSQNKSLRHFARFVNKRTYKVATWDDYKYNPNIIKDRNTQPLF